MTRVNLAQSSSTPLRGAPRLRTPYATVTLIVPRPYLMHFHWDSHHPPHTPPASPYRPPAAAPTDWDAPPAGPPPRAPPTQNAPGGRAPKGHAPSTRPDRTKLSSIEGAVRICRSTDRGRAATANGVQYACRLCPMGGKEGKRRHPVERGVRTAPGRSGVAYWTRGGGLLRRQRALPRHSHGQCPPRPLPVDGERRHLLQSTEGPSPHIRQAKWRGWRRARAERGGGWQLGGGFVRPTTSSANVW